MKTALGNNMICYSHIVIMGKLWFSGLQLPSSLTTGAQESCNPKPSGGLLIPKPNLAG